MIAVVGPCTQAIKVAWSASALVLEVPFELFPAPIHVMSEVKLCCWDCFHKQKSYCMCNTTRWHEGHIIFSGKLTIYNDFEEEAKMILKEKSRSETHLTMYESKATKR
jgi:hypothetical protein